MRILVTGRDGQVARSLAERPGEHELIFAARPDFDLADDASIERGILEVRPDLIISAAAFTDVDGAEDQAQLAMQINGRASGVIGRIAARMGAPVIHLSTDYVFDGSGDAPWCETDEPDPINTYGATKLAGERALAASGAAYTIVRTAWVYSPFGKNFVKTMLELAKTRDSLTVVDDQVGNPTSAAQIAAAILEIARSWERKEPGIANRALHFAGAKQMSWAEFASEIFRVSEELGGPTCRVQPIPSAEFPTKAPRPANSRLSTAIFEELFSNRLKEPGEDLRSAVSRLLGKSPLRDNAT